MSRHQQFLRERSDYLYALEVDGRRWPDAHDDATARLPFWQRAVIRLTPPYTLTWRPAPPEAA